MIPSSLSGFGPGQIGSGLRAVGDRVLIVRVQPASRFIRHVGEQMGVTDRVLQFGEVVGIGARVKSKLEVGQLVVYPSPRIIDQFRHHFAGRGTLMVAVVPGYWVSAVVTDTFIADHPEAREYGALLE